MTIMADPVFEACLKTISTPVTRASCLSLGTAAAPSIISDIGGGVMAKIRQAMSLSDRLYSELRKRDRLTENDLCLADSL
jgi:hypothetical protein